MADIVPDIMADGEERIVVDMEVNKVADMVADMAADKTWR